MDDEELERVVRQYTPHIYRLAYVRTGSRADAEDVTQEVFLRLVRTGKTFESEEHCRAWLLRLAANCANDLFRAPFRRYTQPLSADLPAAEDPSREVLEAVLALPPKYRLPVHLHYYEGLTIEETAAVLGIRPGAVKQRLFRARGMLRLELEGGEDHA